jgi:hypothetical protein
MILGPTGLFAAIDWGLKAVSNEANERLDSSVEASTSVGDASKCRHFLQRSRLSAA